VRRTIVLFLVAPVFLGALYEWGGPPARGVRALRAHRYDEALGALHEGRKELPRSAALRYDEALALEGSGRAAEAEDAYKAALLHEGDRARAAAAFNLGSKAMRDRLYPQAVQWYRESLRVNPADPTSKRALEEALRRVREAPPSGAPQRAPGQQGQSPPSAGSPPPGGSPPGEPPNAAPNRTAPPPGTRGGGEFSREEAEHWLDALEAERRAGRQEDRRGSSGAGGGRDW
jgi:tetratricopeptide (TPR) repeat protein